VSKDNENLLKASGKRNFKSGDRIAVKRFLSRQTFDYYIF